MNDQSRIRGTIGVERWTAASRLAGMGVAVILLVLAAGSTDPLPEPLAVDEEDLGAGRGPRRTRLGVLELPGVGLPVESLSLRSDLEPERPPYLLVVALADGYGGRDP